MGLAKQRVLHSAWPAVDASAARRRPVRTRVSSRTRLPATMDLDSGVGYVKHAVARLRRFPRRLLVTAISRAHCGVRRSSLVLWSLHNYEKNKL